MTRKKSSLAVRFLWIVAGLTVLVAAAAFAYRIFEQDLMRWAMVPKGDFVEVALPQGQSYADRELWIARPDIAGNPAGWTPQGLAATREPSVSVFFIHPTSFLESSSWNAPVDEAESSRRAALFVQSQASAFNSVGAIWAPKYRQAAFGAFLTSEDNARRALDFAYRDVLSAYEQFLAQAPSDRPIILAGHSQGSLHLIRLLQERVKDSPEASRIVAAYVVGWPISETADLPFLPFEACQRPDQSSCILSWQSFAEPADPKQITDVYDASRGRTGIARAGSPMLCTNPLTGARGSRAPAQARSGTLIPNDDFSDARLTTAAIAARCDLRGLLLVGDAANLPEMGPYVLPGNNYHVYDYALFWGSIRADAERRLAAFLGATR